MNYIKITNLILVVIFTLGIFFSAARVITHNNFSVINGMHDNFYDHYLSLKDHRNNHKKILSNENLCHKLNSSLNDYEKGNYRHSLRWVFEDLRIAYFDFFYSIGGKSLLSISFSLMLFALLTGSFFLSVLTINKNILSFISNEKINYLILLSIFLLIISFYSYKTVSELRYSFFEMFFISASLYLSSLKQRVLFLITIVLATLNRESGILIASIWLIFNGFNFENKNFSLNWKEIIYGITFIIISLVFLIFFNLKLFSCGFALSNTSVAGYSMFTVSLIKNLNIIFSNFVMIILLFVFFFKKNDFQIKLIFLLILYMAVFIIFTPANHDILRILFAPMLAMYIGPILKS